MIAYGTNVVGGVNPKRTGETHVGVPIFATTAEAAQKVGADVAVMFIPPPMAKEAAVSAAEAGVKLLVVLTEHIPAQDVMAMHAAAAKHGTRIVGPNTAGLVTPGECFVGIMPVVVPIIGSPPMPMKADWPRPARVRLRQTSVPRLPLREITPTRPGLNTSALKAGMMPTKHSPGVTRPAVFGPTMRVPCLRAAAVDRHHVLRRDVLGQARPAA